jgi:hypothetical protein
MLSFLETPTAAPLTNLFPTTGLLAGSALNGVAMTAPLLELAAVLPAAGPALGGQMGKSGLANSTALHPPDGQLYSDSTVVFEGLGSLSLLPAIDDVLFVMPLPDGVALSASSLLWVASLSSDEDNDDEVLAPRTQLASAKDDVSGLVLGTVYVHRDEEVPPGPCGGLFAAATSLGDKQGWV